MRDFTSRIVSCAIAARIAGAIGERVEHTRGFVGQQFVRACEWA